jgi:dipeptidyl-peptidase-3
MYLSCEFSTLKIFGFGDGTVDMDGEAGDVLYVSYLSMARAGLNALATYDPIKRKWGQAHSQARYSILQVRDHPPAEACTCASLSYCF